MEVIFDPRAKKFIQSLSDKDVAKVFEYIDLFEEFGFHLDQRYLKKIRNSIWELRPGRIRLFIYKGVGKHVLVHAVIKKTQKLTHKDIKVIESRIRQYL